jgi:hypothetical protein
MADSSIPSRPPPPPAMTSAPGDVSGALAACTAGLPRRERRAKRGSLMPNLTGPCANTTVADLARPGDWRLPRCCHVVTPLCASRSAPGTSLTGPPPAQAQGRHDMSQPARSQGRDPPGRHAPLGCSRGWLIAGAYVGGGSRCWLRTRPHARLAMRLSAVPQLWPIRMAGVPSPLQPGARDVRAHRPVPPRAPWPVGAEAAAIAAGSMSATG